MSTLFLTAAIFVLVSIVIGDRPAEKTSQVTVVITYGEWEEPIEMDDFFVTMTKSFNPDEWIFDCGLNSQEWTISQPHTPVIASKVPNWAVMTRKELLAEATLRGWVNPQKMSTDRLRRKLAA